MLSLFYSPIFDSASKVGRSVLSPYLSGPLLLSATYCPDAIRDALSSVSGSLPGALATWLSRGPELLDSPIFMTGLQVLVGLGVLGKVNQALSTVAHNSWRLCAAKGWDNWSDEVAIVTGGSSGIGNAIVQKLTALGVRVAVLDISPLPKEMEADARVKYYHCDVTSSESVTAAADAVRRDLGHPTILVNNAGVANPMPILKTPEASLRRTLGVNLMSMWFTTQQFLPEMVHRNKGHVVTVASIASFVALATEAPYSATKAGALAFHESLSQEIKHQYKSPNVLTSVIHPNFVNTPLLSSFSDRLESAGVRMLTSDTIGDAVVRQIKSKRGGQLIIPDSSAAVSGIRGWPTWLQELVRDAIGKGAVKP